MQGCLVFLASAVSMTTVAVSAAFAAWKFLPAPGTATALFVLFVLSPAIGIASGIRAARWWRLAPLAPGRSLAAVAISAVAGFVAGYALAYAAIDIANLRFAPDGGPGAAWTRWLPAAVGASAALLGMAAVRIRAGTGKQVRGEPRN